MPPDFEKLLAPRDATAQPPRRSERGNGPSIGDVLQGGLSILGQAVTGLPGAIVRLAQDFQRHPLGFTPVGDIQTLMESSDAYARGDIGEGAAGTVLASLGLLGIPMPTAYARKTARGFLDTFLGDERKLAELPQALRSEEGDFMYTAMDQAISGLPSDELRQFSFDPSEGGTLDIVLRTKKGTPQRMAAELMEYRTQAELAARALTGDEVPARAFEFTEEDDIWDLVNSGIMSMDDAIEAYQEMQPTVDYEELAASLDDRLSAIAWMKAVLGISDNP